MMKISDLIHRMVNSIFNRQQFEDGDYGANKRDSQFFWRVMYIKAKQEDIENRIRIQQEFDEFDYALRQQAKRADESHISK